MWIKIFPFISWFRNYNVATLRIDALSGLTVALVLIPQSMAYAQLAGLPAYYGLYASFLPPMIASLFGSSRQLATGPVAVVSLMTSASLAPLATVGSEGYIAYAILLALMVGLFQLALGILRLGLVVNFLSHPVVNGFTNAAAIIIASSQLSKMFGVYVDTAPHHYETILHVFQAAVHYTHWPTLLMGIFAFVMMYGLKWISPRIPNVLVAVVLSILISWGFGYEHNQIASIAAIDSSEAQHLMESFNQAIGKIPTLSKERTLLRNDLGTAERKHDPVGVLDAQHDISVLNVNIARLKHEAHSSREGLRNLLFAGITQADGEQQFIPQERVPVGLKTDGRTWRIKIGNTPLDIEHLTMMGGGAVVGSIPQGLPALSVPNIDLDIMLHLLPFAAIISLAGLHGSHIHRQGHGRPRPVSGSIPTRNSSARGWPTFSVPLAKAIRPPDPFPVRPSTCRPERLRACPSVFTSLAVVIVLLVLHPLALPPAPSGPGGGHHDGRYRPGQCFRICPRLGGPMV